MRVNSSLGIRGMICGMLNVHRIWQVIALRMICVLCLIYYSGSEWNLLYFQWIHLNFSTSSWSPKVSSSRRFKVQRAFLFDAYYFVSSQRRGRRNCWYSHYCIKEHTNYFMDIASFIFHLTVFKYESRNNIDKFVELIVIILWILISTQTRGDTIKFVSHYRCHITYELDPSAFEFIYCV